MATDIKSAARTLDLIEAFAAMRRPITLTEIAKLLKAPVSSCFQLMGTLERRGFAYSIGPRRGYYMTKRILRCAETIAGHDPLQQVVAPALVALRDKTGETVVLAQRVERQALILDVHEAPHTIRYTAQVGELRPLHSTSIGKALLGALSPEARDELIGSGDLPGITRSTLLTRAQLDADLAESATRGWYTTRGENVSDVHAVSAPVTLHGQTFAIAVAGPFHRIREHLASHAEALIGACRALEAQAA